MMCETCSQVYLNHLVKRSTVEDCLSKMSGTWPALVKLFFQILDIPTLK
jgi:hypothetical protein